MDTLKRNRLYILNAEQIIGSTFPTISNPKDKSQLWHQRMGHISDKSLQLLKVHDGVFGNDFITKISFVWNCILDKYFRLHFLPGVYKSVNILEYLHVNL